MYSVLPRDLLTCNPLPPWSISACLCPFSFPIVWGYIEYYYNIVLVMIMMVMMNRMIDIILIFIEIRLSGERTHLVFMLSILEVVCNLKTFRIARFFVNTSDYHAKKKITLEYLLLSTQLLMDVSLTKQHYM